MEIHEGVDDEDEVHGGDGDVVDEAVGKAAELEGMQYGRYHEGGCNPEEEEGRGGQETVFLDLHHQSHHHCHHDEGVDG